MKFQFLTENFSRSENAPPFETRKIRHFEVKRIFLKNKKMLDDFFNSKSDITQRQCSYGTSEWILLKHARPTNMGGLGRPLKNSSFVSPSGDGIVGDSRLYNVAAWKRCSPRYMSDTEYASGNWRLCYTNPRHGDTSCNILFADGRVEKRQEVYAPNTSSALFIRISPHKRDL